MPIETLTQTIVEDLMGFLREEVLTGYTSEMRAYIRSKLTMIVASKIIAKEVKKEEFVCIRCATILWSKEKASRGFEGMKNVN